MGATTGPSSKFQIHEAITDEAREKASGFIRKMAWKSHQSAPPPLPQILLAAYGQRGKILGTFGFDFSDGDDFLPCLENWIFDRATTPLPFCIGQMVQYGRWFTNQPAVAPRLVYTGACYAQRHRKTVAICDIKERVVKRLKHMGIEMLPVVGAELKLESIPEEGRPYYTTEPIPQLMMVSVADLIRATEGR